MLGKETWENWLVTLGEDPHRPGLVDTPQRVQALMHDLTRGQREDIHTIMAGALIPLEKADNVTMIPEVIFESVGFYSLCEHHLLPFFGTCTLRYKPHGHLIGAGRITTLVEHFAKRLQLQERFTQDLATTLDHWLQPQGVVVEVAAEHLCVKMRHASRHDALLRTRVATGIYK